MGLMRFLVPDRDRLSAGALERIYMTGHDDVPWLSRSQWVDDQLVVERAESDSGNLHVPWLVDGRGELVLATSCLMERPGIYHLPVELARGTLHRVRCQMAAWEANGLTAVEPAREALTAAQRHFSVAAISQNDPLRAAGEAEAAIAKGVEAIDALCHGFAEQALVMRRRQPVKQNMLFAVNLGGAPLKPAAAAVIPAIANAAVAPFAWRDVEAREGKRDWTLADAQIDFCQKNGLRVCGGPLLKLDTASAPDWLCLFDGDVDNLMTMAADHLRAVVSRYKGKVHLWKCAGRMNVGGVLSLSEQQCLRLTVLAIETVRSIDPRTPIVIVIDQPWAEFMNRRPCELAPLYFADTLVRADLGLAGVSLEINLGYWPDGTQPRDLLDFNRQIDRWSCLERPLLVELTVPSGGERDAASKSPAQPIGGSNGHPPTLQTQRAWVESLLPLLCSKPAVHGIVWNQLTDSAPHEFATSGLFDAADQPKPVLEALKAIRSRYSA